jgi:hypothetical protein
MALAELTAQLRCLYGPEAELIRLDRAALGQTGSAACAAQPGFAPARLDMPRAPRWITTDSPPIEIQRWPVTTPPPNGWHEVPAEEARRLTEILVQAPSPVTTTQSLSDRVAALSTIDSLPGDVADRRLPRAPREARFARSSRLPREPRAPRAGREGRAPRPARAARPPRPPRLPRPPRAKRPPRPPSKYDVGLCKRPSCTCWTPAGCIGPPLAEAYRISPNWEGLKPCFPGPCYEYTSCVTHVCTSDATCAVFQILQFWVKQYKAVVTYIEPAVPIITAATILTRRALLLAVPAIRGIELVQSLTTAPPITDGCPPGWYWAIGLTGVACSDPRLGRQAATAEQLIAILGYDPRVGHP